MRGIPRWSGCCRPPSSTGPGDPALPPPFAWTARRAGQTGRWNNNLHPRRHPSERRPCGNRRLATRYREREYGHSMSHLLQNTFDNRRFDCHMAHERHHRLFCLLWSQAHYTQAFCHLSLSSDLRHILCLRHQLWSIGHRGGYTHGNRRIWRGQSRSGSRRNFFRSLFRRPRLSCRIQRECGGGHDGDRYLRQRKADAQNGCRAFLCEHASFMRHCQFQIPLGL
mgnify:CR=1 FL=1